MERDPRNTDKGKSDVGETDREDACNGLDRLETGRKIFTRMTRGRSHSNPEKPMIFSVDALTLATTSCTTEQSVFSRR